MNWYITLNEMLDLRSFSNLWFWIALAVMWSTASHWVLGVPYDMVMRAARQGDQAPQAEQDLQDLVRINVNRILYIAGTAGLILLTLLSFLLTSLALLGFVYDLQIAQALFCLGFPMTLVWGLGLRSARRIRDVNPTGAALRKELSRLRLWTQIIGMISIFVTTVWGIYTTLSAQIDENHFKPLGMNSSYGEDYAIHHDGRGARRL